MPWRAWGPVLVPLNVRLTVPELRWQIEQADCTYIICDHHTRIAGSLISSSGLKIVSIDISHSPEVWELRSFSADDTVDWQRGPLDLSKLQGIVFTSGTTGRPKGAMLSFSNHFWSATASAFRLDTDPTDRWLVCMPLYHMGGIAIIFRCCLYGTTVVLHTGFDPSTVSLALASQKITLISLVPTMLHRLLRSHKESLVGSMLRCILLGGAATPPTLLAECQTLNLPVATTYGLTETASQVVTESLNKARGKSGTVGKPLMFSAVRIVGDEGQELPPGAVGEIVIQGPTVMQGYYNQPIATQKALRNGQLYTGDMGCLDKDGDLWVVQRRADLIVSGGENVYPAEVEQALLEHPAIRDVCVVGY